MRVGFLGLGLMGAPIASRLIAASFELRLWNRTRSKAEEVAMLGGTVVDEARDAVRGADVVFLCLTDARALEETIFSSSGIAAVLEHGAVVIDLSTSSPDAAQSFAARLTQIGWLDCPVSGGVAGAQAGTLTLLIGGEQGDIARVAPLLDKISTRRTHLGPAGAGQAAKLCNQLIVSANLIAIAEAVALGRSLGVDVERLPEALSGGFADSLPLRVFGPRMASGGRLGSPAGAIATMAKDTRAIRKVSAASEAPDLPLTREVAKLFDQLVEQGHGEKDLAGIIALQGEELNDG